MSQKNIKNNFLADLVRRIGDILFSFLLLIILSPLFILIVATIWIDDRAPILFRQVRVGKNGELFIIYKFRTMKTTAPKYAIGLDKQRTATRVGKILRKTRLDELPQLWNILIGDMSFVGPRPEIIELFRQYLPKYQQIALYRPGLTSPASLEYLDEDKILAQYRNKEKAYIEKIVPRKIMIDLKYFGNRTIFSDLAILIKTLLR